VARRLSVLIVDPDGERRLDTLAAARSAGLDCAGEAAYGTEVVALTADRNPTVVLFALDDPPLRGLPTLEALQREAPDAPVIVYSASANPSLMRQAMRAGARDYIELPVAVGDLEDAIHTALAHEEQKQLARRSDPEQTTGKVITVVGTKAGAGKTAIAVNLAVALRQLTRAEVALVDADQQFGAAAAMLGLAGRVASPPPSEDGGIDSRRVARSLVRHGSGVDLLARVTLASGDHILEQGTAREITGALADSHEYTIVDAPEEMTEAAAAFTRAAESVLLVSALDAYSLKDSAAAVRLLDAWSVPHERVEFIVNNATRAPRMSAYTVASATGLTPSMMIPYDGRVLRSLEAEIPLVMSRPRSRFARHIRVLAERVSGLPPRRSKRDALYSMFRKKA
jgi:pilus assembly protein CpaE